MLRMRIVVLALCTSSMALACSGVKTPTETANVAMRDIAFEPTVILAPKDQLIRLEFRNGGSITHDFTVAEMPVGDVSSSGSASGGAHHEHRAGASQYALHLALDAGKAGTLDFEPTEAGEYEYFCTVAGHRDAGMRGTIRVQ